MVSARSIQAGVENGNVVEGRVEQKKAITPEEFETVGNVLSSGNWDLIAEEFKDDLGEVPLPPCKFFCAATPQGQAAVPMQQGSLQATLTPM